MINRGWEVKIWWVSGAFERIEDCPDVGFAMAYYKPAVEDVRVECAEVHSPGGSLAFSHRKQVDTDRTTTVN